MAQQFTSPLIEEWNEEFSQYGRVEFHSSLKSLLWRVGLAIAILTAVIYVRYNAGDIGTRGLTWAIAGSIVLVGGLTAFVYWKYGGKKVVVTPDGVTTLEGQTFPWTDIAHVSIWSDPRGRSASAVQLNLTEAAWNAFMASQNAGGKVMHKANKLFAKDHAVVMGSYIEVPVDHLAAFLNQFSQGEG